MAGPSDASAYNARADLPKVREKLGTMPAGQSFTTVLRAGRVINSRP
jgi:hypothetical protein